MAYRDMIFCSFYKDCAGTTLCDKQLYNSIVKQAKSQGIEIAQYETKPKCWTYDTGVIGKIDKKETIETDGKDVIELEDMVDLGNIVPENEKIDEMDRVVELNSPSLNFGDTAEVKIKKDKE